MEGNRIQRLTWVVLALAVASSAAACRNAKRGVRVGSDEVSFVATLNGLGDADQKKAADWKYELSGCVPTVNGSFEKPDKVRFKSSGLEEGLEACQLRVKIPGEIPSDIQFMEGEKRVLYWAREFDLEKNADGALEASVNLTKLYSRKPTGDDDDGVWLSVTISGLAPADQGVGAWIYHVTGCLDGVNGSLAGDGTVEFKADSLKADEDCELRIKDVDPPEGRTFKDGEDGVLYFGTFIVEEASKPRRWTGEVSLDQWYEDESNQDPDADVLVETEEGQCDSDEVYDRSERICRKKSDN